ncbi:MAG: membrane protein insertion efficiency factor YidD [Candidatus Rariloculaceae bacterium]
MSRFSNIVVRMVVGFIRTYQYCLSPWLGRRCRYTPTCSDYAAEAIKLHGLIDGGWLALKRITRCHPWATFGLDPVPGKPTPDNPKPLAD